MPQVSLNAVHIEIHQNNANGSSQEARLRGEADHLEIPRTCLTIGPEIGKGAFGRVFIAKADNICGRPGQQLVAVKQLKSKLDNYNTNFTFVKFKARALANTAACLPSSQVT